MNTPYNEYNKRVDKHVLCSKTVWNSLGASDKCKNDVTSGYSADSKLSKNVYY